MRTPARPRPPDGDCIFISDARIVAGANARGIAADMVRPGFASRRIPVHIAFSVSKLKFFWSFETEKERMMAWVDRNACTGKCRGDELCEGFEKAV